MKKYLYSMILILFSSSLVWAIGSLTLTMEELQQFQAQSMQSQGCAQRMFQRVGDNLTSQYEVQQQVSNSLMGVADAYFEHQKTCDANIYSQLDKWKEEKLRHQQETNKINSKIRASEISYKKAVLELKRQCQETGDKRFAALKGSASSGVLSDVSTLVNRTQNLNKFRKLYYDNCMADPLTIESVQISGMEMKANIQDLEDQLESSADLLTSMTERLKANQTLEIEQCVKGKEQLAYREAIVQNQNAAAQSLTKKQNLFGLLSGGYTCLQNNQPPSDTTGLRAPTSTSN